MATFGKITNSSGSTSSSIDRKKVSSAIPSSNGTATSITIRGRVTSENTVIKGVIYSDSGDAPDALLATSDEITVNSSTEQDWTGNLTGAQQISITAGTKYWIGFHQQDPGSGGFAISRAGITDNSQTNADTYSDGPSDPFGTPDLEAGPIDVYVTYTETGGTSSLSELTDNFDDNSLDTGKWIRYGSSTHVQETGGELRITTSTAGNVIRGIISVDSYNLTSSFASVLLVSPGAIASIDDLEIEFRVTKDTSVNELSWMVDGFDYTINATKTVGGIFSFIDFIPYQPNLHKYFRIREDGGTTYWEWSTDGLAWTQFWSESNPFAVTSVVASLIAGPSSTVTQTTTVRFDDFNIVPSAADPDDPESGNIPISNPINIKTIDRKFYAWKVYNSAGTFLGEWKDVASIPSYSQEINSPGSSIEVELARSADTMIERFDTRVSVSGDTRISVAGDTRVALVESTNSIGDGTDVDLRHQVDLYVFYGGQGTRVTPSGDTRITASGDTRVADQGAPNGRKKFSGYISKYNARYGESETVRVNLFSFGAELDNYILNDAGTTTVVYNSQDPSNILKDILDKFTADGGTVDYTASSVDTTGTTVSYTFRTNTVLEAVKKCLELAPTDWYWYVDMGTNTIFFQEKPTTAHHTFVLGKHIKSLDLERTMEDLVNHVYFIGGETAGSNLYKEYDNTASITSYGEGLSRYSDNRVTTEASAKIISDSLIARGKDPQYRSQVTILDSVYDIENINVGDTVQFRGFNNFVDDLLLQIVGLRYEPDLVTLQLDSLLPSVPKRLEDIKRNLVLQESENNPTAPS